MKKTAIVTGSRRGIGLAIAKKLMSNGFTVILCDVVEKTEVEELLKELNRTVRQTTSAAISPKMLTART